MHRSVPCGGRQVGMRMPGTVHARTRVPGRAWEQPARPRPTRPGRGLPPSPAIASVQRLQETAGNRAVAQLLAGGERRTATGPVVQRDDRDAKGGTGAVPTLPEAIGFIGLNPLAWKEAKAIESPKGQAARRVLTGLE